MIESRAPSPRSRIMRWPGAETHCIAFTLVEMLVVITVVALLIAMLMPARHEENLDPSAFAG